MQFPVLIPAHYNGSLDNFNRVSLHNGTIWRWVRPILGVDDKGQKHMRIEFRVMPGGTSIVDMMANVMLYMGLVRYYAMHKQTPAELLAFNKVKNNFYAVARRGLETKIQWHNNTQIEVAELIQKELLPKAKQGLADLGFQSSTINEHLSIIKERVKKNMTGSQWQRDFYRNNGRCLEKMLAVYNKMQHKNIPVHEWPLSDIDV